MGSEIEGLTSQAGTEDESRAPRVPASAPRRWQRWVRRSAARRAAAVALTAGVLGGGVLTACNADSITGPASLDEPAMTTGPSLTPTLLTASDEDSDNWPKQEPEHRRKTQEEADADPDFVNTTETTFPVTEAVYNTCRNEGPIVLNGFLKSRMRTETDPFGGLRFQLKEYKDTRGIYGTFTYQEDYYDDNDHSWKQRTRVVRYRNKEFLLDQFKVGPAGAPFRSEFVSTMWLEREGPDPYYVKQPGDDLFVQVIEIVKIGTNGIPVVQHQFKSECK